MAFRLVVASSANPPLLIEMNVDMFLKALEHWRTDLKLPLKLSEIENLLNELEKSQSGFKPNRLWLSWMKSTRADIIQTFTQRVLI